MAEEDFEARARDLLRQCSTMTLATSGPEGLWAADVFFAPLSLSQLCFISGLSSRHSRNILASPAAAATIHVEAGQDWRAIRGLQLAGRAALVPEARLAQAREAYFAKFPFSSALLKADSEVAEKTAGVRFFLFQVQRLYLVDNRLGFGVRQEINLGVPSGQ